jgi:hypothetical protein
MFPRFPWHGVCSCQSKHNGGYRAPSGASIPGRPDVSQADNTLRGAELVEAVISKQLADHLLAGRVRMRNAIFSGVMRNLESCRAAYERKDVLMWWSSSGADGCGSWRGSIA